MANGYLPENLEAILEALESDESDEAYESDESDELAERRRRSRSRGRGYRPRTASGKGLVPPKPSAGYVTEARLEAALARVGSQIKTNSDAIAGVNTRLTTISADISRQETAVKKEAEERKKDTGRLSSQAQLSALLPLLLNKSIQLTSAVGNIPANTKVLVDSGDNTTLLLPLLAMGGLGTGSGSSSGSGDTGGLGGIDPLLLVLLLRK